MTKLETNIVVVPRPDGGGPMRRLLQKPPQNSAPMSGLDAHSFLVRIYQDETQEIGLRVECAKAAIRFEKPALASVEQKTDIAFRNVVALPEKIADSDAWPAVHSEGLS